jgi:hypothetical protein
MPCNNVYLVSFARARNNNNNGLTAPPAGFVDPLLEAGAQAASPQGYPFVPWLYTPFIGIGFPSKDAPLEYFSSVTGVNYTLDMLSWNPDAIGSYHPLVQHKRLRTGKAASTLPKDVLRYNGLPYMNFTRGVVNMTGADEGGQFQQGVGVDAQPAAFDSILARPLVAEAKGEAAAVRASLGINMRFCFHSCSLLAVGLCIHVAPFDSIQNSNK